MERAGEMDLRKYWGDSKADSAVPGNMGAASCF